MSQENVEVVHRWAKAWQSADREGYEAAFAFLHSEIEWDATRVEEMGIPDLASVYRGPEGVHDFWRGWSSAWSQTRFEFEVREAGDEVVLLLDNQRQWGRHTGIEIKIPPTAWVFTFRGERMVRGCWYPDHHSALEAAGLSE